jgi:LysM repeat protein
MNKNILISTIFLFLGTSLFSTGDSLRILSFKDTLRIETGYGPDKIFQHTVIKGQTIFAIIKFYNLTIKDIEYYNKDLDTDKIKIGTKIKIPVADQSIIKVRPKDFVRWKYAPVYYTTKKGDNLFNLAKKVFIMPMDSLKKRNGLKSESIPLGTKLHIGWMSTKGWESWKKDIESKKYISAFDFNESQFLALEKTKKPSKSSGFAFWAKNSRQKEGLFCLHNKVPLNSIVKLSNPLNNRIVYCKVVGKYPESEATKEFMVVISNTAAKMLGSNLEDKFKVDLAFYP